MIPDSSVSNPTNLQKNLDLDILSGNVLSSLQIIFFVSCSSACAFLNLIMSLQQTALSKRLSHRAVDVAQLAEQLLPMPEVPSSNPVMRKIL